jgi:folate-binding protein YgfZ
VGRAAAASGTGREPIISVGPRDGTRVLCDTKLLMANFSSMVDAVSSSSTPLLTGTGVAMFGPESDGSGWIAVTGDDRVRWLNGMVTNSVQALTPGEGAYSFLLSVQGRIQGDVTVWAEADRLLMQTAVAQVEPLMTLLDRFIIMDDVELADLTPEAHGLLVAGPKAVEALAAVGLAARASKLLKRQTTIWQGHGFVLVNAYSPLVPRFEIWSNEAGSVTALHAALLAAGAADSTAADVDLLRVAEGTPRFGVDLRDRDLPQETAQTRALHFNKGCYLGQEIVERIRSRGNVHRTFARLVLHGDVPAPGTPLLAEDKPVGELTSVASALIDGQQLALGFVRREAIERGLPLTYAGGVAKPMISAPTAIAAAS